MTADLTVAVAASAGGGRQGAGRGSCRVSEAGPKHNPLREQADVPQGSGVPTTDSATCGAVQLTVCCSHRAFDGAPEMVRVAMTWPLTGTRAEPVAVSSSCTALPVLTSAAVTRSLPLARTANCVLYLVLRQLGCGVATGSSGWHA